MAAEDTRQDEPESKVALSENEERFRLLIDSLQMTEAHRQQVLEACRESSERSIVVVHGTDTMVQTAQVIGRAALDKTVVFTGAMVPYSVQDSDAPFNLGFALSAALTLPAGAYVAMNARIFSWDDVQKDRGEGAFKRLAEK